MAWLHLTACLTLLTATAAVAVVEEVTPVEQVINLITGLKEDVEKEGKAEASSYNEYACFCKDNTKKRSSSIVKGNDKINVLSASIADKTESRNLEQAENTERSKTGEELAADLDATVAQCEKDKAEYDKSAADMAKAISSSVSAIKGMEASKPNAGAAALIAVRKHWSKARAFTGLRVSTRKVVEALLQRKSSVDPDDAEFSYHSDDIIEVMQSLLKDFRAEKAELDSNEKKRELSCKATEVSFNKKIASNKQAMATNAKQIGKLGEELATAREQLVGTESAMKDDELYLKDLTASCEAKAKDFDQRSKDRGDELTALSAALKLLTGSAKEAAEVNKRAAFVEKKTTIDWLHNDAPSANSFLQLRSRSTFLARGLSPQQRSERSLAGLQADGRRIGSLALSALAVRAQGGRFDKVKVLISQLIERLVEESVAEGSKKGFCDTSLAKAEQMRDRRWMDARDLSAAIARLEDREDELGQESKVLKAGLKDNTVALELARRIREEEKMANAKTIAVAEGGLEATSEAMSLLHGFYSAALLQQPKRGKMGSVFGLLESLTSDFRRTIRSTEAQEESAVREFQEVSQSLEASTDGKETDKALDAQELKSTKFGLKSTYNELKETMELLDNTLKEIEGLKATCISTGMTYSERVKKREEEMAALQKALCIVDPEGVEDECK